MSVFFRSDIRRMSWAEVWRHTRSVRVFCLAAILRLLNRRPSQLHGISCDGPHFIDRSAVPADCAARIEAAAKGLEALGFKPQF